VTKLRNKSEICAPVLMPVIFLTVIVRADELGLKADGRPIAASGSKRVLSDGFVEQFRGGS
jgi:hypothetical protein